MCVGVCATGGRWCRVADHVSAAWPSCPLHPAHNSVPQHGTAGAAQRTLTGSKLGWMTPLEGEAFLTSAIRPGLPVSAACAWIAPMKSRGGGDALAATITVASGTRSLHTSRGSVVQCSGAAVGRRQGGRRRVGRTAAAASRAAAGSGGGMWQPPRSGRRGRRGGRGAHLQRSTSTALCHTISSRMLRGWFSSARPSAGGAGAMGRGGRAGGRRVRVRERRHGAAGGALPCRSLQNTPPVVAWRSEQASVPPAAAAAQAGLATHHPPCSGILKSTGPQFCFSMPCGGRRRIVTS